MGVESIGASSDPPLTSSLARQKASLFPENVVGVVWQGCLSMDYLTVRRDGMSRTIGWATVARMWVRN